MFIIPFILSILPYNIGINIWAFHLVNAIASPGLNGIMSLLSESYLVVLPAVALYMYVRRKDMNVYSFVVAFVVLYIVSDIIKMIVREPRPCTVGSLSWINSVTCEVSSFGFPSNHASVLTVLPAFMGSYRYVRWMYIVWLVVILFGRVYLGAHYLTDVIAGIAVSIAIGYAIYRYHDSINRTLNGILRKIHPSLAIS